MRIVCTAKLSKQDQIIGYRLLDVESKTIKDVPVDVLKGALRNNLAVENIKLDGDKIRFTEGSEERYCCLKVDKSNNDKTPLYILYKSKDGMKFMVTNGYGEITIMDRIVVINYGNKNGISNGKIVNKEDVIYISAINTPFKTEEKLKEKRFVLLEYISYKDSVKECKSLLMLDTVKNKFLNRSKMYAYRQLSENNPQYESLSIRDKQFVSYYPDVYPIKFPNMTVFNSKRSYTKSYYKGVDFVISHSKENGEVIFKVARLYLNRNEIKYYNLCELIHLININKDMIVGYRKNGDKIIIDTATDTYIGSEKDVEDSDKKFKGIRTTKAKLNLMDDNTIEINELGVLTDINRDCLIGREAYRIPSAIRKVKLTAIWEGDKDVMLMLPDTIEEFTISKYDGAIDSNRHPWKCIECHTRALANCINKLSMDKVINLSYAVILSSNVKATEKSILNMHVEINEDEWVKLACIGNTVITSNRLSGKKILDYMSNYINSRLNRISNKIKKTVLDRARRVIDKRIVCCDADILDALIKGITVRFRTIAESRNYMNEDYIINEMFEGEGVEIDYLKQTIRILAQAFSDNIMNIDIDGIDLDRDMLKLLDNINDTKLRMSVLINDTIENYTIKMKEDSLIVILKDARSRRQADFVHIAFELEDNKGEEFVYLYITEYTNFLNIYGWIDSRVRKADVNGNIRGSRVKSVKNFKEYCNNLELKEID